MTDINFYSESEMDYVKEVIPISFYEQDLSWMDPDAETVNFWLSAEYGEESEFVKMTY